MRDVLYEDELLKIEAQVNTAVVFMHLEVKCTKWSLSKHKHLKGVTDMIKSVLKDTGLTEIYSCVPKDDDKLNKFQRVMGMVPHIEFLDSVLYRQEL